MATRGVGPIDKPAADAAGAKGRVMAAPAAAASHCLRVQSLCMLYASNSTPPYTANPGRCTSMASFCTTTEVHGQSRQVHFDGFLLHNHLQPLCLCALERPQ